MKNLMDEYVDFTSKKIKKYVKMVLRTRYNDDIVQEFLKTYINKKSNVQVWTEVSSSSVNKILYIRNFN